MLPGEAIRFQCLREFVKKEVVSGLLPYGSPSLVQGARGGGRCVAWKLEDFEDIVPIDAYIHDPIDFHSEPNFSKESYQTNLIEDLAHAIQSRCLSHGLENVEP